MKNRAIGIDISCSNIHAVQLIKNGDDYTVEKSMSTPTRSASDSISRFLSSLTNQHGFDNKALAAVNTPTSSTYYQDVDQYTAQHLHNPTSQIDEIFSTKEETLTSLVSYQHNPYKQSFIAAATNTAQVQTRLDMLAYAALQVNLIEVSLFALHTNCMINHPTVLENQTTILLYSDENYLGILISEKGEIVHARNICLREHYDNITNIENIDTLIREITLSWFHTYNNNMPSNITILCSGDLTSKKEFIDHLTQQTMCLPLTLSLDNHVKYSNDIEPTQSMAIAQGLALRSLSPDKTPGINFLCKTQQKKDVQSAINSSYKITGALICSIAMILFIGYFVQYYQLSSLNTKIETESLNQFNEVMPKNTKMILSVAPVQLKSYLKETKAQHDKLAAFLPTTLKPLEVIALIQSCSQSMDIQLSQFKYTPKTISIMGKCNQSASYNAFIKALESHGMVSHGKQDNTQKNTFNLKITMRQL